MPFGNTPPSREQIELILGTFLVVLLLVVIVSILLRYANQEPLLPVGLLL